MIGLLLQNRFLILGVLFIASTGGAFVYGYLKGSSNERIKIVYKQIEVMDKRSEIANNRPDKHGVVKRLRSGTF